METAQVHKISFCAPQSPLRKHAYSNILKILPQKKWNISDKNSDIFHISVQNIDCRYSLEPPRRAEIREIIYTL